MHLTVINNPDESKKTSYKLARVICAETNASSLAVVEALASMVANLCIASKRDMADIATDPNVFECLDEKSPRHERMAENPNSRGFDMCLRVVSQMMRGNLGDKCRGATRFHHDEIMPEWASSIGYVADVDGLLFYKGGDCNE